jgi:hypothetical protein
MKDVVIFVNVPITVKFSFFHVLFLYMIRLSNIKRSTFFSQGKIKAVSVLTPGRRMDGRRRKLTQSYYGL